MRAARTQCRIHRRRERVLPGLQCGREFGVRREFNSDYREWWYFHADLGFPLPYPQSWRTVRAQPNPWLQSNARRAPARNPPVSWLGHLEITSNCLLSILERSAGGAADISIAERSLFMACEFWAAARSRTLVLHLGANVPETFCGNSETLIPLFSSALAGVAAQSNTPRRMSALRIIVTPFRWQRARLPSGSMNITATLVCSVPNNVLGGLLRNCSALVFPARQRPLRQVRIRRDSLVGHSQHRHSLDVGAA